MIMIMSDNKRSSYEHILVTERRLNLEQIRFKHFKHLLERNSDHSALSVATFSLYFLP